jgi:hypothetical protein
VFVDVPTARSRNIESRGDCLVAREVFKPGPYLRSDRRRRSRVLQATIATSTVGNELGRGCESCGVCRQRDERQRLFDELLTVVRIPVSRHRLRRLPFTGSTAQALSSAFTSPDRSHVARPHRLMGGLLRALYAEGLG